jgi:hypothetical protein
MDLATTEHVDLVGEHLHRTRTWQRAKTKGNLDLAGAQVHRTCGLDRQPNLGEHGQY